MAAENERWEARAEDPQSRSVLAEHFRMALTGTNAVEDDSAPRSDRNNPAISVTGSLFWDGEPRFPYNVGQVARVTQWVTQTPGARSQSR